MQPSPEPQVVHCWPPKPQKPEDVPARQTPPAVMQPPQHTPLAQAPPAQGVKSGSLPLSVQVATLLGPPGQAVMPVLHWVGLVEHTLPPTQLLHAPPEQPLAQLVSVEVKLHRPPAQEPPE